MKQRREKAIEYRHEKAKREREEKAAEKDRRQKYAVREQMRVRSQYRFIFSCSLYLLFVA